ncbi:MAG: MFS transporter [Bacillaceae bacterium]|nr:MFS transporter [Bacillaceae bacterium]
MINRNFNYFWFSQTISLFGSQISILAIPITAVSVLNANSIEMGILLAMSTLPFFLFSLFAGLWIDRTKRKPFLFFTNIISAILLLIIPVMHVLEILNIYFLYAVIFLTATSSMIFELAYLSYIPSIVKQTEISSANSKLEASRSISSIAGPSLAGILISIFTAPFAILIDSISFIVSATLIKRIKSEEKISSISKNKKIFKSIKEGILVIFKEPIFRSITLCTAVLNFCGSAFGAIYILYLVDTLHISSSSLGLILGLGSVGALFGSFIANKLIKIVGLGKSLIYSCILMILGSLAVPSIPSNLYFWLTFGVLCLGQLFSSIGSTVYFITQVSLRQSITPNHLLGRVNSSNRFISRGLMPIGALLGGALGELIGLKLTLFIFSAGFAITIIILLMSPVAKLNKIPESYELLLQAE